MQILEQSKCPLQWKSQCWDFIEKYRIADLKSAAFNEAYRFDSGSEHQN